jgi:hypothetical protein
VKGALGGVRTAFMILERASPATGAFTVLKQMSVDEGVVVVPLGDPYPAGLSSRSAWSGVEVGPCWGPEEPLVSRWAALVAAGRHVWTADPGRIPVVAMPDAVAAVTAAALHPQVRWRIAGTEARLPDIVDELGRQHARPVRATRLPLSLAMQRVGVDPNRIREWLAAPRGMSETPGWTSAAASGSPGWVNLA